MSDKQMVSVPREQMERFSEVLEVLSCHITVADDSLKAGRAIHSEMSAILAKPAEQHQGEPVALPARKQAPGNGKWHCLYPEHLIWNACLDKIAKLGPLYTRPAQGEVVAWRFVEPGDEYNGYQQKVRVTIDKPSATRARLGCEPLYAHADPAEVERLETLVGEIQALRLESEAQLAERDAECEAFEEEASILRDGLKDVLGWIECSQSTSALRAVVEKALSASAEPSALTWSCQACQVEQPTDRPCDVCGGKTEPVATKS